MQALILSAGEGKRLRPLTNNLPKVMIDILGKPLLDYHIKLLNHYGITNILINLHYMPEKIVKYFGNGKKFGVKIRYSREPKLLGSAGALHNFRKYLLDNFFVLYGDVFMKVNLDKMLNFHIQKKSHFTLAVHESKHPKDSDLVEIDSQSRIINWLKIPHGKTSGINSAGLYIISRKILNFLPAKVPLDFAHDFIPFLLAKKESLYAYSTNELMMDIGTIERYNKLLKILQND